MFDATKTKIISIFIFQHSTTFQLTKARITLTGLSLPQNDLNLTKKMEDSVRQIVRDLFDLRENDMQLQ